MAIVERSGPRRSHCEACGEVPASAYDLNVRHARGAGVVLVMCRGCWALVLCDRPVGVSIDAVLEELYEHRYQAPQRKCADGQPAAWQGSTHSGAMGRQHQG